MGNSVGGKRRVKVMKLNGETMKVEAGTEAGEITKTHPNHVVLESEAVKHFGIRAPPLKPDQKLDPNRLYFLLELPTHIQNQKLARRVRSNVTMSAKDRLESLMLARRSSSDLSVLKKTSGSGEEDDLEGSVRVRVRLRREEVEKLKLMRESGKEDEAAEKLMNLCMEKFGNGGNEVAENGSHVRAPPCFNPRQKKVSFLATSDIQEAVAS